MKKPYLSKVNGDIEVVCPRNGSDFSLEELQGYVDGLIEIVDLRNGMIAVVNEEGKFTKEMNVFATFVAHTCKALFPNDYIAGDVLFCPSEMVK